MNSGCITISLSLRELSAAALMEAAERIEMARDLGAFVDALNGNHRLWMVLRDIEVKEDWIPLPVRDVEFATEKSVGLGKGISDAAIHSVIAINREIAQDLIRRGNITRICARVRLAYRENGGGRWICCMDIDPVVQEKSTEVGLQSRLASQELSSGRPGGVNSASVYRWPVAAA